MLKEKNLLKEEVIEFIMANPLIEGSEETWFRKPTGKTDDLGEKLKKNNKKYTNFQIL